jgi:pimeloyl-ACP methyl ester carboxylesterase
MPFNLAVFSPNTADVVIAEFPQINHWVIGGHSLGGAMAANYARNHANKVQGLVFWASYPASTDDLSTQPIAVASISGSLDAFTTPDKIAASRVLLPSTTSWVKIDGGNHSQFGYYGLQPGDNPASLSRADQQQQAVEATIAVLKMVSTQPRSALPDTLLIALTRTLLLTP